jgi:hypothetical protein
LKMRIAPSSSVEMFNGLCIAPLFAGQMTVFQPSVFQEVISYIFVDCISSRCRFDIIAKRNGGLISLEKAFLSGQNAGAFCSNLC